MHRKWNPGVCYSNSAPKQVPRLLLPTDAVPKLLLSWQSKDTTGPKISAYILLITIILPFINKILCHSLDIRAWRRGAYTYKETIKQAILHKGLIRTTVLAQWPALWSQLSHVIYPGPVTQPVEWETWKDWPQKSFAMLVKPMPFFFFNQGFLWVLIATDPICLLLLLLLSHFSRVWLCVTPYTAAHQAPPSLGFSRQERWSGVPLPSPLSAWVPFYYF